MRMEMEMKKMMKMPTLT